MRIFIWGWDKIEADFYRFYQADLYEEVYVKKITFRRFVALVSALPADSAWVRFAGDKNNYSLPSMLC